MLISGDDSLSGPANYKHSDNKSYIKPFVENTRMKIIYHTNIPEAEPETVALYKGGRV